MIEAELLTEHLLAGLARARMLEDIREGKSWEVDLVSGWIRIGEGSCRVQLVGTYAIGSGSFLWGWANPSAGQWTHSLGHALQLKERGGPVFGVAEHTEPSFSIPSLAHVSAELCGRPLFAADHADGTVYLVPDIPLDLASFPLAYLGGVLLEFGEMLGYRAPPAGPAMKRFLERLGFSVSEQVDASDEDVTHLHASRGPDRISLRIDSDTLDNVEMSLHP